MERGKFDSRTHWHYIDAVVKHCLTANVLEFDLSAAAGICFNVAQIADMSLSWSTLPIAVGCVLGIEMSASRRAPRGKIADRVYVHAVLAGFQSSNFNHDFYFPLLRGLRLTELHSSSNPGIILIRDSTQHS
jgi:hypothetical protein